MHVDPFHVWLLLVVSRETKDGRSQAALGKCPLQAEGNGGPWRGQTLLWRGHAAWTAEDASGV